MRAEQQKVKKPAKYLVPLVTLPLVIAIMVVLFLNRDKISELGNWGYLGAFLIGLVANATVFLPMPSLLLLFALGATFNPVLVGLAGAAGGAIGEISGYVVGYSGHAFIRNTRAYIKAEGWVKRWGAAAIFMFALIPFLPLDIAGIVAGVSRFPLAKFLVACWLGKALLYTCMALAGAWGWEVVH